MHFFKRGAFLTLGMTFISILILTVGIAMLRTAEHSEERMYELGSMERLFGIEQSVQHAYRGLLFGVFPFQVHQLSSSIGISTYVASPKPDPAFLFFTSAHNVSEDYIRLISPNFISTTQTLFPQYNHTAFFFPDLNVSVLYVHNNNAAGLSLPSSLPSVASNALVVYVNTTQSGDFIDTYVITLKNTNLYGNVSWETFTSTSPNPGENITVEYFGAGNQHTVSSSRYATFASAPDQSAQNITINMTGPKPWPLVSVSTAATGPFAGYGQIVIEPFVYNFTATVTLFYSSSLGSNVTAYSYDRYNVTLPFLGVGRAGYYRLL